MVDGRSLMLPRHTQPERDLQAMLNQLQITLPSQPPPRIESSQSALRKAPGPISFCGGDLSLASTESKALSSCETLEL